MPATPDDAFEVTLPPAANGLRYRLVVTSTGGGSVTIFAPGATYCGVISSSDGSAALVPTGSDALIVHHSTLVGTHVVLEGVSATCWFVCGARAPVGGIFAV